MGPYPVRIIHPAQNSPRGKRRETLGEPQLARNFPRLRNIPRSWGTFPVPEEPVPFLKNTIRLLSRESQKLIWVFLIWVSRESIRYFPHFEQPGKVAVILLISSKITDIFHFVQNIPWRPSDVSRERSTRNEEPGTRNQERSSIPRNLVPYLRNRVNSIPQLFT